MENVPDYYIGPAPIDVAALVAAVSRADCGAVACFLGTARGVTGARRTAYLEYEAYGTMAERTIREIAADAAARHGLRAVAVHHRTGRVEIGEASVAVVAASPHRAAAFAGCAAIVERLKREAPIWKKEHGPDGTFWVEGPSGS